MSGRFTSGWRTQAYNDHRTPGTILGVENQAHDADQRGLHGDFHRQGLFIPGHVAQVRPYQINRLPSQRLFSMRTIGSFSQWPSKR
jgi:hypothetical protein